MMGNTSYVHGELDILTDINNEPKDVPPIIKQEVVWLPETDDVDEAKEELHFQCRIKGEESDRHPSQCDICHAEFESDQEFLTHRYTHTEDICFTCCICYKTYVGKEQLKSHVVRQHGNLTHPYLMSKMERKRSKETESKKDERKRLRTSRLEYTTYRGEVNTSKHHLESVDCRCKWQCKSISLQQLQGIFDDFHKMTDPVNQKTYLLGLIQIGKINRRRHGSYDAPEHSRRQVTIFYSVPNGQGGHLQVCRNTFSKIFALSHNKVQVLTKKKKSGSSIYEDTRYRADKPRKFLPAMKQ